MLRDLVYIVDYIALGPFSFRLYETIKLMWSYERYITRGELWSVSGGPYIS